MSDDDRSEFEQVLEAFAARYPVDVLKQKHNDMVDLIDPDNLMPSLRFADEELNKDA